MKIIRWDRVSRAIIHLMDAACVVLVLCGVVYASDAPSAADSTLDTTRVVIAPGDAGQLTIMLAFIGFLILMFLLMRSQFKRGTIKEEKR